MARKNFKYLVRGHVAAIVVFGILFFVTADKAILLTMIAFVFASLLMQFFIYRKKPGFFNDKTTNHPDLN